MEINDILKLIQAVSDNELTSFKLEEGNLKLAIKKQQETPQILNVTAEAAGIPVAAIPSQIPAAPAVSKTAVSGAEPIVSSDKVITSPLVGTFYNASAPGAEPFVKEGDTVKKGQVLGIIEAMKLMNEIESEYDGVVEAVLVNNEDVVEYGQALFRIR